MSDEQPRFTLGVSDVPAWLAFLTDRAGFQLVDAAQVWLRTPGGALFALGTEGASPDAVTFRVPDVDALHLRLPDATLAETSWGDRVLTAPAPEGTLRLLQPVELPPAEALRRYAAGPDELAAALAKLSDVALDRSLTPDSWSIRRNVHHVVDGDLLFTGRMQAALADSGRQFTQNWPTRQLDIAYAARPIGPSVALFRTLRAHWVAALAALPQEAWERHVVDAQGSRTTFLSDLTLCARHAAEHTAEIRAICERA